MEQRHKWVGVGLALLFVGCGDDSAVGGAAQGGGGQGGGQSAGCTADPFACGPGTVCWILTDQANFDCLNSGPGVAGETCINTAGQPSCGDGLACLQLAGDSSGVCTPYCDPMAPQHACPDAAECLTIMLAGSTYRACEPPAAAGGAGQGGASGGGGAG